jgi:hypothetical protein
MYHPSAREATSPATRAIPGMGTDAPTATNTRGGRQSELPYRFDLVDPAAMFALAQVLAAGATKYGVDNWRQIDTADHLNHALAHIYAYLAGDRQDDHLSHALCRAMFAYAVNVAETEIAATPDVVKIPVTQILRAQEAASAYFRTLAMGGLVQEVQA